jgi:hypothetical protein
MGMYCALDRSRGRTSHSIRSGSARVTAAFSMAVKRLPTSADMGSCLTAQRFPG